MAESYVQTAVFGKMPTAIFDDRGYTAKSRTERLTTIVFFSICQEGKKFNAFGF
jgi:hypothetical protein